MEKSYFLRVRASDDIGLRLDKYLHNCFPDFSRSHLQHLIQKKNILLNGEPTKSSYALRSGDSIKVMIPEPEPSQIEAENIPLEIIYEDRLIIVINKPDGLVVHPGPGNRRGTLVNSLLYHCKSLSGINGVLRPGIVHRLDKHTSGLLLVAKNDQSHVLLARQFESHDIIRTYQAIVWGVPARNTGEIDTFINRSNRDRKKMSVSSQKGKRALTSFEVVTSFTYFSLLQIKLKTGRTHQIRVHLNHINHPVFGDPQYGGRNSQLNRLPSSKKSQMASILKNMRRQALHAKELRFIHPGTKKEMCFDTVLPEDMQRTLQGIKQNFNL